ncbi:MAG: sulfatase-like hydrolase/transferase, partial [Tissierellia bacterium]|nr:sulfatase-like hydrolase/transferase [Tissierellia bacterium]
DSNVIVLMIDSLRYDHLGFNGNTWIKTPNLDKFAQDCIIFDNAYPEGLPTIPVRTSLFTGNRTLPFRPWQPLEPEDITIAEILASHGYLCALIADTYHLAKPGMNLHKGFHIFRWIRGQEADAYESTPHNFDLSKYMKDAMKGDWVEKMLDQYFRNRAWWQKEEDYFTPRVMNEAISWLKNNTGKHEKFFLWIDNFDPHEPWDPPDPFDKMYTNPDYKGPKLIHPKYGPVNWMTEEELQYVRGLYAGEVAFVDKWVGKLFATIDELGLLDNTLIIVLADHGHPHGDHGTIMKTPENLYSELLKIPLLVRLPGASLKDKRVFPIVGTQDIPVSILEFLGMGIETECMDGRSVWPLVEGKKEKIRDYIVSGFYQSYHRVVRNEDWSYIRRPQGLKDELYSLKEDPKEKNNLIDQYPEVTERMRKAIGRLFWGPPQVPFPNVQLEYEVSGTPIDYGMTNW